MSHRNHRMEKVSSVYILTPRRRVNSIDLCLSFHDVWVLYVVVLYSKKEIFPMSIILRHELNAELRIFACENG
jgi:hypothetical protein